jgi:hypothetical protein
MSIGLVIAKLLAKDEPAQIRNIQDLRKLENFKIIVKNQSFVEDLFAKSLSMQDLRPRIVLEEFNTNNLDSLKAVLHRILSQDFVLVDDKVSISSTILRAPFLYCSILRSFSLVTVWLGNFLAKEYWRKSCL